MNEQDTGIEKETISFYPMETSAPKAIEIKFTLSGSSFKIQLPILNQSNAEDFFHFLHEFDSAKTKLGCNTCPKLESGVEQLLQGNAKNEWNTIKNTVSPDMTTFAAFNILAFKRIYVPDPSAVDIQRNYLQQIGRMIKWRYLNSLTV